MRPFLLGFLLLVSPALFAWTTNGPHGGPAHEVERSRSQPNVIYLASAGGVFHSDDNGVTWSDRGLTNIRIVEVDPVDPDVVFAASYGGVVSKSTDGGRTWRTVLQAMTTNVEIDPVDRNLVYAVGHCAPFFKTAQPEFHELAGAYRSTDGGETWTAANAGLEGFAICVQEMSVDPLVSGRIFVTATYGEGGQAISTNAAQTWTRSTAPLATHAIVVDPRTNIRYGFTGDFRATFYSSADGLQWTRTAGTGITGNSTSLTVDPATGRLFLGTSEGIFRSGDGGNTWARIANSPLQVLSLLFDPATSTLLVGTMSGLQRANWITGEFSRLDVPDHAVSAENLAVDPTDPATLYTSTFEWMTSSSDIRGRIFRSTNSGASWETIYEGAVRNRITVDARGDLYAGASTFETPVYRLPKGSSVWEETGWIISDSRRLVAHPVKAGEIWSLEVSRLRRMSPAGVTIRDAALPFDMAFAPNGGVAYIAGEGGFAITTDDGQTVRTLDETRSRIVAIAPSRPTTVYRVRVRLAPPVANVVERSDNAGATWTEVAPFFEEVTDLGVEADNPSGLWIATARGRVLRPAEGGTFRDETDNLPPVRIHRLELSGGTVHLGTSAGVWSKRVQARRRAVQ
ncbi:MAG TPA: hypothetical protein VF618_18635 [Thermoanaerobaculia bacterium]